MKNSLILLITLLIAVVFCVWFVFYSVGPQPIVIEDNTKTTGVEDSDNKNIPNNEDLNNNPQSFDKKDLPKEQIIKKISFLATGDNLIHSSLYSDAEKLAKGTEKEYFFTPMYENIRSCIENADIAFVNQEGPIGGKELGYSGYPNFNAPNEAGDALIEVGFDIINLANNHMLDKGEKGYIGTLNYWDTKQNITSIGGYNNNADYDDFDVIEKNGLKIALLSFTYGTNGMTIPASSELKVPIYSEDEIDRLTKKARTSADLVFVSIHWGAEDAFNPNDEQINLAKLMAKNGVDVILGHHPHVLQPIEWLPRPDGKKTLVAYSLGNLLSGMMYSRNMVGGLLTFDIEQVNDQNPEIKNVVLIPTMCHYNNSVREFKLYKFADYTNELQKQHGCHKFESVMSMDYLKKIITDTISKEFLPTEFQ